MPRIAHATGPMMMMVMMLLMGINETRRGRRRTNRCDCIPVSPPLLSTVVVIGSIDVSNEVAECFLANCLRLAVLRIVGYVNESAYVVGRTIDDVLPKEVGYVEENGLSD